jgi:hypothetical protein
VIPAVSLSDSSSCLKDIGRMTNQRIVKRSAAAAGSCSWSAIPSPIDQIITPPEIRAPICHVGNIEKRLWKIPISRSELATTRTILRCLPPTTNGLINEQTGTASKNENKIDIDGTILGLRNRG